MSKYSDVLLQTECDEDTQEASFYCEFCNATNIVRSPCPDTEIECHSCKQTIVII